MRHTREMHAYEVPVHEMHAREVHAHEMHAHKVQARETHVREMHACEVRILCSHHAFVQSSGSFAFIVPFVRSSRRRSSPGQGSQVFL
jgi:hypothetical protein